MKLTTREKVLLTILLAVIASWLSGCNSSSASTSDELPNVAFFQQIYDTYNNQYFDNKLPKTVDIDLLEPNDKFMASTMCDSIGVNCKIHFNMKYVSADRVARITMKHEMCHVKTWMKDMDSLGMQVEHGKIWRSCMLQLDIQGAFRQDIIDGYVEEIR
jgi:hypothetical protein